MNNGHFSDMDVDGDGNEDIVVFDREGSKISVFIHDGNSGVDGYRFAPEWARKFPRLAYWAVLRDVNCDGVEDIFTSYDGSIALYKGTRVGGLSWDRDTSKILYEDLGFFFEMGVTDIDLPAFEDMDGDGDIDILTFNLGGGFIEYFMNRADDNGDPCGDIDLILDTECWGKVYESGINKEVALDTCNMSPLAPDDNQMRSTIHAGSTLAAFDEDGDGVMELILGDLLFDNLNKLTNGGTPEVAFITGQDTSFPAYNVPFGMNTYPVAFHVDADKDGDKDLLVGPNSKTNGKTRNNVWLYDNAGSVDDVNLQFQADDFLVGQMIEVGRGAAPVFFDHNSDGLLDIIIGNTSYRPGIGDYIGQLALYENSGTAETPAFEWVTDDYAGVGVFGFSNVHPALGDLDGDGDLDLLIGEDDGAVHFFANNPVSGVSSFVLSIPAYQGIDPGKATTPNLVDIDRDGDLDLLMGERNGNINFYRNSGTSSSATFELENETFGDVVILSGTGIGFTQPWIYDNPTTGEYELYVGQRTGTVYKFEGIEADLSGTFTQTDSIYGGIDDGERARVCVADLNNDGNAELIVGNLRGGLTLYKQGSYPSGISSQINVPLKLWPNPSNGIITVSLGTQAEYAGEKEVQLIDLTGKVLFKQTFIGKQFNLNFSGERLAEGIYFISINGDTFQSTAKILIAY
ncbi:MAG: hypothetical protein ACI959_001105 [Limisphaerales bacterium]